MSGQEDNQPGALDKEKESASGDKPRGAEGQSQSTAAQDSRDTAGEMDFLSKLMAKVAQITTTAAEEEKPKILESVSIEGIANYIKDGKAKNIIVMTGAGISTSAGIPDFRSPGTGLYSNLQKYNLPDPQAIFEIGFFKENPRPFFELSKELKLDTYKPTPCHYFIRMLNDKGMLLRNYTQNIDTLERLAGLPGSQLVEAHGSYHTGHCLECRKEYPLEWMKEEIAKDKIPSCTECEGIVKPDIVFFGESLPERFFKLVQQDFQKCDMLMIMGTSLAVQPFASLVNRVKDDCPRLLINKEKCGQTDPLMQFMGLGRGLDFDAPNNNRDVAYEGDCDDGCFKLAELLGWKDELKTLVSKEQGKLASEAKKKESTDKDQADKPKESSSL
ncbi:NAD-dependent protein deacetylase sirtuin-2-like isoform X2 [Ptychodera flava]|uniref:NAD-dependent protein deacetylase sirtuin-2-like isoform X2 n=1 Tax=Ptychodera flava TaxID=63121 RepID=UPI00396A2E6D